MNIDDIESKRFEEEIFIYEVLLLQLYFLIFGKIMSKSSALFYCEKCLEIKALISMEKIIN